MPASLMAFHLALPLHILWFNYRDSKNRPIHTRPRLEDAAVGLPENGRILLVDDVSVSGKTLDEAVNLLGGRSVTTLVLKGHADIVLFPSITECIVWPWKRQLRN